MQFKTRYIVRCNSEESQAWCW